MGPSDAILDVAGLEASYGRRQVVFGVTLDVRPGEVVTVLGHNGAGKTTTLRSIFGIIEPAAGSVRYQGRDVERMSCLERVRSGMSFVPAERFVFPEMTVLDNLRLGGECVRSSAVVAERIETVFGTFPLLMERQNQLAGTLSGGQQRILSVGTALMSDPKLMLLDELSLGLAPVVFQQIAEVIRGLVEERQLSVLLLEQNVSQALDFADRAYVMRSGRIILEESVDELRRRENWWDLF